MDPPYIKITESSFENMIFITFEPTNWLDSNLYEKNISAIFGPGSNIIESAEKVIDLISDKNNQ